MSDLEIRNLSEPIEFRSEDGRVTVTGVAIKYGALSKKIPPGFIERIEPGAATKALEERDVKAVLEHDRKLLLGSTEAGTLRLTDTATELRYELDLPDTSAGRDAAALVERRDLRGTSFGFKALKSSVKWSKTDNGMALRSVGTFENFDHVSLTAWPAYPTSTAELALRSLAEERDLDLSSLIEAARAGTLPDLIDSEHRSTDPVVDAPPAGTVRRRITSLYL